MSTIREVIRYNSWIDDSVSRLMEAGNQTIRQWINFIAEGFRTNQINQRMEAIESEDAITEEREWPEGLYVNTLLFLMYLKDGVDEDLFESPNDVLDEIARCKTRRGDRFFSAYKMEITKEGEGHRLYYMNGFLITLDYAEEKDRFQHKIRDLIRWTTIQAKDYLENDWQRLAKAIKRAAIPHKNDYFFEVEPSAIVRKIRYMMSLSNEEEKTVFAVSSLVERLLMESADDIALSLYDFTGTFDHKYDKWCFSTEADTQTDYGKFLIAVEDVNRNPKEKQQHG